MSRTGIIVATVGLLAVAGIVSAVIVTRDDSSQSTSSDGDRIGIELRANPVATIYVDGKKRGTTPMRLQFPKSTREITIKAEMIRHLVGRHGTRDDVYEDVRTITLDRDQLLDFTLKTAKKVSAGAPSED